MACADQSFRLWDSSTWKATNRFHLETLARAVTFSPDGKTLAAGLYLSEKQPGECIFLWDVATWKERAAICGHRDSI